MAFDLLTLGAAEQITAVYVAYFGRAPDPDGLDFWVGEHADGLDAGKTPGQLIADIADSFSKQSETHDLFPFFLAPETSDPGAFVDAVFLNLFNRLPDPEGRAFWVDEIDTRLVDGRGVGTAIIDIISGAQDTAAGLDATTIGNKIEVGAFYADTYALGDWTVADDREGAVDIIAAVDDSGGAVEAGREAVLTAFAEDQADGASGGDGFDIVFDYRFDDTGFFDDPAARAALERAGSIWESLIHDDFADVPAGIAFTIDSPATLAVEPVLLDAPIDDLLIFVGARPLPGSTLGRGGADGFDAEGDVLRARISDDFRGQGPTSDYEPWAGTVAFDSTATWSFALGDAVSGMSDFISVALHEIGHVLGIGTAGIFEAIGAGALFDGPNALAANGGAPIPLEPDLAHIREGFAGDTALMDPITTQGTRDSPSPYDLALLADIGYEIDGFTKQGATPPIATEGGETIFGTIVADTIDGLGGDDTIQGDAGDDLIVGGAGDDTLFGQEGTDTFAFAPGSGADVVVDFNLASEVLLIDPAFGFASPAAVLAAASRPFSNVTRLNLAPGDTVDIFHDNVSGSGTPLTEANVAIGTADGFAMV